jgi:hypothetical protein
MVKPFLWACVGACVFAFVAIPMLERHAAWEARTIACWPNKEHPAPFTP